MNVIFFIVTQMMAQMETMRLVEVHAVHGNGTYAKPGTVDVLPLVQQIDGQGNVNSHGTVYGLPWFRVQGGGYAIICDPKVGDVGYVVCANRDSSTVISTGQESPPGSRRSFDLADGIYMGGILGDDPTQYVAITDTGIKLVDNNGNVVEMKLGGVFITGNVVITGDIELSGTIKGITGGTYSGDLHIGGNVIAGYGTGDQVGLQTHTHHQGVDSHGDTEQPTNAPTAGT